MKANFPIFTEQVTGNASDKFLKAAQEEYQREGSQDSISGGNNPADYSSSTKEAEVGVSYGRQYSLGAERPGFVHPSSEPVLASMKKQEQLKFDIRSLVHLSLSNVQAKSASADSKTVDNQGLEAGLSNIGLELQNGERQIAEIWAMYEKTKPTIVSYPENWGSEDLETSIKISDSLLSLREKIPSIKFQREMSKIITNHVLSDKISSESLQIIHQEIESAPGITADPITIASDLENGLVGNTSASALRGYPKTEVEKAKQDHAERLAAIQKAQMPAIENPAARGNPDASVNPTAQAKLEKA